MTFQERIERAERQLNSDITHTAYEIMVLQLDRRLERREYEELLEQAILCNTHPRNWNISDFAKETEQRFLDYIAC